MAETTSSTAASEPPKHEPDQTSSSEFPICNVCGSEQIVRDAWVSWDAESKEWQPTTVFDHAYCQSCEGESSIEWRSTPLSKTERIRMLNDALRTGRRSDGTVLVTVGVNALGPQFVTEARKAVTAFDDFNADNDPHGEHDFGALNVQNEKLFFKIDYYDLDMSMHSPDAADPSVTKRVLTIMLASEY